MVAPSEIQLIIKAHRTAIFIQLPLTSTLPDIKSSTLSALQQFSSGNPGTGLSDIPVVSKEDEFEVCRLDAGGTRYVELDGVKTMKEQRIGAWSVLYLRFRDESGTLLDVNVTEPNIDDDEEPGSQPQSQSQQSQSQSQSKGKGRA